MRSFRSINWMVLSIIPALLNIFLCRNHGSWQRLLWNVGKIMWSLLTANRTIHQLKQYCSHFTGFILTVKNLWLNTETAIKKTFIFNSCPLHLEVIKNAKLKNMTINSTHQQNSVLARELAIGPSLKHWKHYLFCLCLLVYSDVHVCEVDVKSMLLKTLWKTASNYYTIL